MAHLRVVGNTALKQIGSHIDDSTINAYMAGLDVKEKSKATYRKALKRFVCFLEDRGIEQPTRADILEYKTELMCSYSDCTVSSYLTAVKGLYAYMAEAGLYSDIAKGIKGAKHQRGFKKDALTIEQAKNVLVMDTGTIEGKRNYALVNLLIRTGLRTIEAQRADIDDIRQQSGQAVLYIQGKGRDSKDAFVVLTEATLKPIRDYLNARSKAGAMAGEPLFISHSDRNKGERLTTRSISRIAKGALKAAGIDSSRLTAHSLRHTAVTFSLLAGASIQEAQSLARHSSINTTLIYAHNLDRIEKAPERRIDTLLD